VAFEERGDLSKRFKGILGASMEKRSTQGRRQPMKKSRGLTDGWRPRIEEGGRTGAGQGEKGSDEFVPGRRREVERVQRSLKWKEAFETLLKTLEGTAIEA